VTAYGFPVEGSASTVSRGGRHVRLRASARQQRPGPRVGAEHRFAQHRSQRGAGQTGEEPERPVGERLGYVWMLPAYGAAVLMSTAFTDVLHAGRWRSALDDLAAACGLEPDAEETQARAGC
jgi:hypothetical protein